MFILGNGKIDEYDCPKCHKGFKGASSMRRHMKYFCANKPPPITGYHKHSEEDYECVTCHRHYKLFCTVKRHIIHECGKPKKIECPIVGCEYLAKLRYQMISHCRMVHKIEF